MMIESTESTTMSPYPSTESKVDPSLLRMVWCPLIKFISHQVPHTAEWPRFDHRSPACRNWTCVRISSVSMECVRRAWVRHCSEKMGHSSERRSAWTHRDHTEVCRKGSLLLQECFFCHPTSSGIVCATGRVRAGVQLQCIPSAANLFLCNTIDQARFNDIKVQSINVSSHVSNDDLAWQDWLHGKHGTSPELHTIFDIRWYMPDRAVHAFAFARMPSVESEGVEWSLGTCEESKRLESESQLSQGESWQIQ